MRLCLILADQSRRATTAKIGEFIAVQVTPSQRRYVWRRKFWEDTEIAKFNETADAVCREHINYGSYILPYAVPDDAEPVEIHECPNCSRLALELIEERKKSESTIPPVTAAPSDAPPPTVDIPSLPPMPPASPAPAKMAPRSAAKKTVKATGTL